MQDAAHLSLPRVQYDEPVALTPAVRKFEPDARDVAQRHAEVIVDEEA
jgi:hypothetical protein